MSEITGAFFSGVALGGVFGALIGVAWAWDLAYAQGERYGFFRGVNSARRSRERA